MMFNPNDLAAATKDAYSFPRYGKTQWLACSAFLAARGYSIEQADAILRSKIMRYAADNAARYNRATVNDLADCLDHRMGGAAQLAEYIRDVIEGIKDERAETVRATFHIVVVR